MKQILENIRGLNLDLPNLPKPGGSYSAVVVRGCTAFVAIQFPIENGEPGFYGRIGTDLTTAEAVRAAEICALNIIGQVQKAVGFEHVEGLNHLEVYFQQAENWDEGPVVADGASQVFRRILGSAGDHTRAVAGVQHLPRNFPVGISASFTLINVG